MSLQGFPAPMSTNYSNRTLQLTNESWALETGTVDCSMRSGMWTFVDTNVETYDSLPQDVTPPSI
jgi:hypothetical protein